MYLNGGGDAGKPRPGQRYFNNWRPFRFEPLEHRVARERHVQRDLDQPFGSSRSSSFEAWWIAEQAREERARHESHDNVMESGAPYEPRIVITERANGATHSDLTAADDVELVVAMVGSAFALSPYGPPLEESARTYHRGRVALALDGLRRSHRQQKAPA